VRHTSIEKFAEAISSLVRERDIGMLIIGLPLLPSGQEGGQTKVVKEYVSALASLKLPMEYLDERYTTPAGQKGDGDALSALSILRTYNEKKGI
jgi:RNase H-fold protein (predicted Holliday junction resolvase)